MSKVINSIIVIALWLGLRSLGHFIILYINIPSISIPIFDMLSLVLVIMLSSHSLFTPLPHNRKSKNILTYLWGTTIISASILFVMMTIIRPYGMGDAIAIWNLRARYLYYAGLDWDIAFSPILEFSHLDYPLLIPLNIMRTWELLGQYHPIVPAFFGVFYTLGTVSLLFYIVQKISSKELAILSSISLLVMPNYIGWGAGQIADIPLAFYILLSASLMVIWRDSKENSRILYLVGLALGCASWVKNEGLLVILAFCVVSLFFLKPRLTIRQALQIASTVVPFLIINILFKSSIDVSNDLISGQGSDTLSRIVDLSRYFTIMNAYMTKGLPYIALLVIILIYATRVLRFKFTQPDTFISMLIILILLGYFVIFLTTPNPLDWHLETALDRLLMHTYPLAILMIASMFPSSIIEPSSQ